MNYPIFKINWMKNTLLFTCRTNILICLPTVNMRNFLTPKIPKCATLFQRHIPIRKWPPPPGGFWWMNVLCHFLALFMWLTTLWEGWQFGIEKGVEHGFVPKRSILIRVFRAWRWNIAYIVFHHYSWSALILTFMEIQAADKCYFLT